MNEANSPLGKRGSHMLETFGIPHQPNIPPGSEHNFSKEGFLEGLPGHLCNVNHVRTIAPVNLKICPNSSTEIALEEKMISGLQMLSGTENTLRAILDMPMPSENHIFGIETVHDHQLGKNFGFQNAARFPIQFKRGFA